MKNKLILFIGVFLEIIYKIYSKYRILKLYSNAGKIGQDVVLSYPFCIKGPSNLILEDDVFIGPGATIYCSRAKCIFKAHSFTGPNLTIITGNHAYWPGTYMKHCYKRLLNDISAFDKTVIIEADVWIGANVTILKGVTIGTGSIVSAGSVVIKDVEPYSIVGGVPAKFIKYKWTKEEIKLHEDIINGEHS